MVCPLQTGRLRGRRERNQYEIIRRTSVVAVKRCTTVPSATVTAIDPTASTSNNVVTYGATITLGSLPDGIRLGQTAEVTVTTDDFGFKAVEKPVHVHDIHATILHLLGIDHTKLTYHYSGRDFRLTDVHGKVIHDIIA